MSSAVESIRALVETAAAEVARRRLEFATFLVGVSIDDPDDAETLAWKSEIKRAAAAQLAGRWSGARLVAKRPDLAVIWDDARGVAALEIAPIFVYGRYRKLSRELSQTRWHCPACRGRGCPRCEGKGRRVEQSVEDLIAGPLERAFDAESSTLHGAGREDRDALMLGRGRPFVVELTNPRLRTVDLEVVAREVAADARVELARPLALAKRDAVARVKVGAASKTYRARCVAAADLEPARVAALASRFSGALVEQRTPERVSHRRVDKVRPRRIARLAATLTGPRAFDLELETEHGTYVKELVSSDQGRTTPSITAELGVACKVIELDVLDVALDDDAILA